MRLLNNSNRQDFFPTFICVGAEKCGTTALYDDLKSHPSVYMPPIKETNFFSTDVLVENFRSDYKQHELNKNLDLEQYFRTSPLPEIWGAYLKKESHYLQLFADGRNYLAKGEVSNSYFYSQNAAQNIADTLPDARIIVLLRNPAKRAFSHYRAMVRDGRTFKNSLIDEILHDQQFEDRRWGSCHGYIDHGLYSIQLEQLFRAIDRSKIKVIISEEFFRNKEEILKKLFKFISVPTDGFAGAILNRNRAVAPRNARLVRWLTQTGIKSSLASILPAKVRGRLKGLVYSEKNDRITEEEYRFLQSFFVDEKRKVEALLGREIPDW